MGLISELLKLAILGAQVEKMTNDRVSREVVVYLLLKACHGDDVRCRSQMFHQSCQLKHKRI